MIFAFIVAKMSAYIAGGMEPAAAARFTRGELEAVYKGDHYSRDNAGKMRPTEPPENIPLDEAMGKYAAAINEILKTCAEMVKEKTAPEKPPADRKRTGLEGLKNYVERRPA